MMREIRIYLVTCDNCSWSTAYTKMPDSRSLPEGWGYRHHESPSCSGYVTHSDELCPKCFAHYEKVKGKV